MMGTPAIDRKVAARTSDAGIYGDTIFSEVLGPESDMVLAAHSYV